MPRKLLLPVPEFTSDRMRLLAPLLTPRVLELARERVMTAQNLFSGSKLRVADEKPVVRLALLLAHEMNPFEDFSAEEEGMIRGINADTVRNRKKAGLIRPL